MRISNLFFDKKTAPMPFKCKSVNYILAAKLVMLLMCVLSFTSHFAIAQATNNTLDDKNSKINERIIDLIDYQKRTLIYINDIRKEHNLPPFKYDKQLEKLAIEQSKYLKAKKGDNNILTRQDHVNGNNEYPSDRIEKVRGERLDDIGTKNRTSENIVTLNLNSVKKAVGLWMESKKGHREAILGPYTHIGIGYEKGSNFFITVFAREKETVK